MIKLVVYLGNYGIQYEKTRHNIGWLFEASLNNNKAKISKFKALYYKDTNGVIHLLPQTYMNNSGESVIKAMQFFKIEINEVLVVHDDLETQFGSFKFKVGGGLGGHNGLRSIAGLTGSKDFHRLALGISRPARGDVASYVLQRFNKEEEAELEDFFNKIHKQFKEYL
ncbi:MAG: aminoacyl-tRNA hydrolase [Spirochaetales bacterium]|nr:aminoacyl-tRNA hydrolase [Spirochaetales bacterium]